MRGEQELERFAKSVVVIDDVGTLDPLLGAGAVAALRL
jgi:hypothetical protein